MVVLKTSRELKAMRDAGRISSRALKLAGEAVEPGVSTLEIDRIVRKYIEEQGATPSFRGTGGNPHFPRLRRIPGKRLYFSE